MKERTAPKHVVMDVTLTRFMGWRWARDEVANVPGTRVPNGIVAIMLVRHHDYSFPTGRLITRH
jgi:hypothetical protein